jgi:hypothetical protein
MTTRAEKGTMRRQAWDRSGGLCEHTWCGLPLRDGCWELAHRMGGAGGRPWHIANVLALHPGCHRDGPHGTHREVTTARELGLLVPSWGDYRTCPLHLPPTILGGAVVLLDDHGGYLPLNPQQGGI